MVARSSSERTHHAGGSRPYKSLTLMLVVWVMLLAIALTSGCKSPSDTFPNQPTATQPQATELKIEDTTVGAGAEAKSGDLVTVNYTGWLTDGTKFDSSVDRNQPFQFRIGEGKVIPGWEQGVAGMKVGGKRKLTIPADLGYGAQGAGGVIPPNATLVFDIELLGIN